jgi:D-alanyl-D-alanine carboxypeptidase
MSDIVHHSCRITRTGVEAHWGDPTARFPYWSFTKTVIAAATLRLAETGEIDLDEPLPREAFTLRQLLGHRAGLPDYGGWPDYHAAVAAGEPPWPRKLMLDRALSHGPLFAPGTGWHYSNIGYMLAVRRLEQVTSLGLADLLRHHVLQPLDLSDIRLAEGGADFHDLYWPAATRYDPGWVYHGCLVGTAAAAARLLHGLVTGQLLHADSLSMMQNFHPLGGLVPGRPWTRHGYGLGLMIGEMGVAGRAIGHSGGGPFCVNAVYHFPDRDGPATIACFTDGTDEGLPETIAAGLAMEG